MCWAGKGTGWASGGLALDSATDAVQCVTWACPGLSCQMSVQNSVGGFGLTVGLAVGLIVAQEIAGCNRSS